MITFDKKRHKYFDRNGREYTSVTKLLGRHFPFNGPEIAYRCSKNANSKYYKKSVKEILHEWNQSSVHGNHLHNGIEKYIKEKTINEKYENCINQFAKLKFRGKILSEQKVWHEGLLLAGTADVIEDCDDYMWLWDIKTYKTFNADRHKKMSLQLNIYKILIENVFEKPCKLGGIILFEDFVKLGDKKTKMTVHPTIDVKDILEKILKDRMKEVKNLDIA